MASLSASAAGGGDGADEDGPRGDFGAGEGDYFAQASPVADADAVADDRGPVDADVVAELAAGAEQDGADERSLVAGVLAAAVALDQLALALHLDGAGKRVEVAVAQLLEIADVIPVGVDLVRVEGDIALEQAWEDIHRPVAEHRRIARAGGRTRPGLGEEVEDLGAEHVDARVGKVGKRFGGVGLL